MSERQKLLAMVQRCNRLGDRVSADITRRILTRSGLSKLDEQFILADRIHQLFLRIYVRYEGERTKKEQ